MKHRYTFFLLFLIAFTANAQTAVWGKTAAGKESGKNFVLKGYLSTHDMTDFTQYLEDHIPVIIQKYNPSYTKKVKIRLFESADALHAAAHRPEDAPFIVGYSRDSATIWMVNPYCSEVHNYTAMKKVLVHEYTHLVVNSINPAVPIWLNEGIAVLESGQNQNIFGFREHLRELAETYKLPRFDTLACEDGSVYRYADSLVLYIQDVYSAEKLFEFIQNPDIQAVFSVSDDVFQESWRQYLTKY